MNSDMTYTTTTDDSAATRRLAQAIGAKIQRGMVIEMVGDLGSGKTTFTQGLAVGLGFGGEVTSPTFTIQRSYPISGGRQLHHFDWYRLNGPDPTVVEFTEDAADPTAILVVEWADNPGIALPAKRLRVTLKPLAQHPDGRQITIESLGGAADKLVGQLAA